MSKAFRMQLKRTDKQSFSSSVAFAYIVGGVSGPLAAIRNRTKQNQLYVDLGRCPEGGFRGVESNFEVNNCTMQAPETKQYIYIYKLTRDVVKHFFFVIQLPKG